MNRHKLTCRLLKCYVTCNIRATVLRGMQQVDSIIGCHKPVDDLYSIIGTAVIHDNDLQGLPRLMKKGFQCGYNNRCPVIYRNDDRDGWRIFSLWRLRKVTSQTIIWDQALI